MTETAKLEPCPFCESIEGPHIYSVEDGNGRLEKAYVACEECEAQGPSCEGVGEAAIWWNRRSASSDPDSVRVLEKIAEKYTSKDDPLLITMTRSMFVAELRNAHRGSPAETVSLSDVERVIVDYFESLGCDVEMASDLGEWILNPLEDDDAISLTGLAVALAEKRPPAGSITEGA